MLKHTGIHIAIAALTLLAGSIAGAQTLDLSETGQKLDGIAAVVNDGVVLQSELDAQTAMIVNRLRGENTPLPPFNILRQQILESLVIKEIQLQRAARAGIRIPDEMLNRAMSDIARRNGITLSDLPGLLEQDGMSYSAYRREMREQMTIERLRQRDVISRIGVNPRELEEYLAREAGAAYLNNRYKVSHILISVPAAASPDEIDLATGEARDLYEQLEAGADFAQLAVAYSDAQTALDGGSMGWREGDALPTLFAEIVPAMQPGEISVPVRTNSGFHIIKLDAMEGTEAVMENQTHARHILIETDELMDDDIVRRNWQRFVSTLLKAMTLALSPKPFLPTQAQPLKAATSAG